MPKNTRPIIPHKTFLEKCQEASGKLENLLSDLCLDPASLIPDSRRTSFISPPLIETLHEYQSAWIESKLVGKVVTSIGRAIMFETLDYCMDTGRMVLIEGEATTGKTIMPRNNFCQPSPRTRSVMFKSPAAMTTWDFSAPSPKSLE